MQYVNQKSEVKHFDPKVSFMDGMLKLTYQYYAICFIMIKRFEESIDLRDSSSIRLFGTRPEMPRSHTNQRCVWLSQLLAIEQGNRDYRIQTYFQLVCFHLSTKAFFIYHELLKCAKSLKIFQESRKNFAEKFK